VRLLRLGLGLLGLLLSGGLHLGALLRRLLLLLRRRRRSLHLCPLLRFQLCLLLRPPLCLLLRLLLRKQLH